MRPRIEAGLFPMVKMGTVDVLDSMPRPSNKRKTKKLFPGLAETGVDDREKTEDCVEDHRYRGARSRS